MRIIFAAAFALAASQAQANDSTAELTTGGLVLSTNADIEMRSEDLAISEKQIDVHYRFFNHAATDATVTVAFPMPDVMFENPDSDIAIPDPEVPNFLDFRTVVDGAPVQAQYEQKAMVGDVDVTARLKALGVPLPPQAQATSAALDRLPRAVSDQLIKDKIAMANDYDVGKGDEHHVMAIWTFKSTFYWRQTFPAGREVAVEHHYTPSLGTTAGTALNMSPIDPEDLNRYRTLFCVDNDFLAGKRAADAKSRDQLFSEKRIGYVLKTGANWAGPIGDFRLTVDKGAPDALVSFCADGVKKIGPTTFEVHHANFTPKQDLHILILYHPPKS